MTRGAQPELDLLRHLERVPGMRMAPTVLGSAIIRSPNGERSASAVLEDIDPDADTVRDVLVHRLRRSLEGDPSLQAVALDDVRAVGVVTRELHAALGRPFEQGVVAGAEPAAHRDVESWVARAWNVLTQATLALKASPRGDPARLLLALDLLPGKLQQFAAAAEGSPGLVHRIHGNLQLDTILIAPPRQLSVVEFDGDALLPDADRVAPLPPWRDVARLLLSIAAAAADAARLVGGDEKAFEIAWLWEREARKAYLEGYGTGGGALHALLAIFELEFAAQHLLDALAGTDGDQAVAAHTLQRLSRTIV
jgi:predicted trehalose synthase